MKTKILFTLLSLSGIFLTSCEVLKSSTSKTLDIYGAGVIQKPMLVDLDIKESKVTGTATSKSGLSMENVKNDAVANALKSVNADVLVEPKFESETTNGRTTVVVKGFPATYKNFRPVKIEDIELLKVGITQKAEVFQPKSIKQKSKAGAILGVILGVGLLIFLLGGI